MTMAEIWTSLISNFLPLLIFIGLLVWFLWANNRQTSRRYAAQVARVAQSIDLQRGAVELQQQSVALLADIRDSLRGKP